MFSDKFYNSISSIVECALERPCVAGQFAGAHRLGEMLVRGYVMPNLLRKILLQN